MRVAIIMGSASDWKTMQPAAAVLDELGIEYEAKVISAHRTPDKAFAFAAEARERGVQVIIAGAGGAAHLPGVLAAKTTLPVIGVPVDYGALNGIDALLSIAQMPGGIPVATMGIGSSGAKNAGLMAASMLSITDEQVAAKLASYRDALRAKVEAATLPPTS